MTGPSSPDAFLLLHGISDIVLHMYRISTLPRICVMFGGIDLVFPVHSNQVDSSCTAFFVFYLIVF